MTDILDDLDPTEPLGWLRDYIRGDATDLSERMPRMALDRLRTVAMNAADRGRRYLYIEGYDEPLMGPRLSSPTSRQWLHRYIAGDSEGSKAIHDLAHEKVEAAIAEARAEGKAEGLRARKGPVPTYEDMNPHGTVKGWTAVQGEAWREDASGTTVVLTTPRDRFQQEIVAYVMPKYEGHVFDLLAMGGAPAKVGLLCAALAKEEKRPNLSHDGTCTEIAKVLPVLEDTDVSHWSWQHNWTLHSKAGREIATIWPGHEGYSWHTWDANGVGGENSRTSDLDTAAAEVLEAVKRQGFETDPPHESEEEIGDLEATIEAYEVFQVNVAKILGLPEDTSMVAVESEAMAQVARFNADHQANMAAMDRVISDLKDDIARLRALVNTPHTDDWLKAVPLEAAHQIERWGTSHDAGKAPQDWFWLLGYLGGKALHAAILGDVEKAKHHTISAGAALLNWHRAMTGDTTAMRPGIKPPE